MPVLVFLVYFVYPEWLVANSPGFLYSAHSDPNASTDAKGAYSDKDDDRESTYSELVDPGSALATTTPGAEGTSCDVLEIISNRQVAQRTLDGSLEVTYGGLLASARRSDRTD